jgi:hypothetical protein
MARVAALVHQAFRCLVAAPDLQQLTVGVVMLTEMVAQPALSVLYLKHGSLPVVQDHLYHSVVVAATVGMHRGAP